MQHQTDDYCLKLAETDAEREAVERLRWQVFVEEMGATAPEGSPGRERDAFDDHADHLILTDRRAQNPDTAVVGVYRLMRGEAAQAGLGFYSAGEYDLEPLMATGRPLLELGRSCIAPGHRGGTALRLLWLGLADYVTRHGTELLFGVASFPGTDPAPFAPSLAYLHRTHRAAPELRAVAHGPQAIALDPDPAAPVSNLAAVKAIPPLMKSYLRIGGKVGDGAYIDRAFNTIDVFLVMDTAAMAAMRSVAAPARRAA